MTMISFTLPRVMKISLLIFGVYQTDVVDLNLGGSCEILVDVVWSIL